VPRQGDKESNLSPSKGRPNAIGGTRRNRSEERNRPNKGFIVSGNGSLWEGRGKSRLVHSEKRGEQRKGEQMGAPAKAENKGSVRGGWDTEVLPAGEGTMFKSGSINRGVQEKTEKTLKRVFGVTGLQNEMKTECGAIWRTPKILEEKQ